MYYLRPLVFVVFALVFWGCQKENGSDGDKDCTVQYAPRNGTVISDQYVVYLKKSSAAGLSKMAAKGVTTNLFSRLGIAEDAAVQVFSGVATGFVAKLTGSEAQALKQNSEVAAVEPDRVIALSTCFKVVAPTLLTWGTKRVGFGDGKGKTAWIIDTGIDFDHPDLNVDVARSRSFVAASATANDENGHGTHVAGIIGAKNNDFGMLGVASGATLVALKVLNGEGEGKLSSVINALNYIATAARPGDVVNMSLGEEGISEYLDGMITDLASRGILFAVAAGNEHKTAASFSPGRVNHANVFTVSAIDSLDNFASFSNYGNDVVDFAAPGVRIVSCYKDGKYARLSGSSMAAPHVAGLLLLNGRKILSDGVAKNDPDPVPDPIAHH